LEFVWELESWTNDRIQAEMGVIQTIPRDEWVTDQPLATVIMAAFCHPHPGGSRFNDGSRGAWYCAFALRTAHAEAIYHRTVELEEIGVFDTFIQMREYQADFDADFHDIRKRKPRFARWYSPTSYAAAQRLAGVLLQNNSSGIVYRSVRDAIGTCLACLRPRLVANLRMGAHFEYRWAGGKTPEIRTLSY
ncbi:MAG: RES family NAD+ phosphorylase, partial [Candidatus Binataceae bacterium]